jgi:hypothetical protein
VGKREQSHEHLSTAIRSPAPSKLGAAGGELPIDALQIEDQERPEASAHAVATPEISPIPRIANQLYGSTQESRAGAGGKPVPRLGQPKSRAS